VAYGWPKLVSVDGKMEAINGIDESPENLNVYLDAVFDGLSALLAELGDDVPVVVIGNVPTARLRNGYPWCADRPFRSAACHQSFPRAEGEFAQAIVRFRAFAAASRGRVWFLDPYESLCDDKSCYVVRDRTLYYSDHGHLTLEGAGRIISGHRTLLADAFAHGRRN
jgi:hypothetical protein